MSRVPRTLSEKTAIRAGERCEYCRLPQAVTQTPFQADHIRAIKHQGPTTLENLAWTCFYCNSFKGPCVAGFDPLSQQVSRLCNPRRDRWPRHFFLDKGLIKGKTKVGRTTVDVLNLNDGERVRLRLNLMKEGWNFSYDD